MLKNFSTNARNINSFRNKIDKLALFSGNIETSVLTELKVGACFFHQFYVEGFLMYRLN